MKYIFIEILCQETFSAGYDPCIMDHNYIVVGIH